VIYLGQHAMAVSPRPIPSAKIFGNGFSEGVTAVAMEPAVGVAVINADGAKTPVRAREPFSYFTATPAVVQDAGQAIPGEWYANWKPVNATAFGAIVLSICFPLGRQSPILLIAHPSTQKGMVGDSVNASAIALCVAQDEGAV
jgi:hypothetical protein